MMLCTVHDLKLQLQVQVPRTTTMINLLRYYERVINW